MLNEKVFEVVEEVLVLVLEVADEYVAAVPGRSGRAMARGD